MADEAGLGPIVPAKETWNTLTPRPPKFVCIFEEYFFLQHSKCIQSSLENKDTKRNKQTNTLQRHGVPADCYCPSNPMFPHQWYASTQQRVVGRNSVSRFSFQGKLILILFLDYLAVKSLILRIF